MRTLLMLIAVVLSSSLFAQDYNPNKKPNTYRSNNNSNYWKNKRPSWDYWQQDVYYKINGKLNIYKLKADSSGYTTDLSIDGSVTLTYWNNSPDTLNFVYFHLYQNAFQEGAYYDNLKRESKYKPIYGLNERDKKGTDIKQLKCKHGVKKITYDNTIVRVDLNQPILPNTSTNFDIDFKTYFGYGGSSRRRMKAYIVEGGNWHFNTVHWYPRISVYDRKFGWTTDQHLDKEFYGDFGTFDVTLDLPSNYVVGATGTLQNASKVFPDSLKKALNIKNFFHRGDKSKADTLKVFERYSRKRRKQWNFYAENVHDFAWTADPTYRIDEKIVDGVLIQALVEERHASNWKTASGFTGKVIQVYSRDFGQYIYPKMIVADAREGMEYPMITLDTGKEPGYRGLLAHEVGHNWFFGMVGSNETYRALMDEGFTQFLTAWSLIEIDGDTLKQSVVHDGAHWYLKRFRIPHMTRESRAYYGYLVDAMQREDHPINTHSSEFGKGIRQGGGYRHVYNKTATMLYNLQYVLGDELFLKAMQNYFSTWKLAHPYPADFRKSIISYTKVDLNWFFDQWLETTKVIDYSIKKIRKGKGEDEFLVTFKRKGDMQMPIDFRVIDYNDSILDFHIPNGWFVKKTSANILPKWYGFGSLQKEYTVAIKSPNGIQNLIIDPSKRLADVYPIDNELKMPKKVHFDAHVRNLNDLQNYRFLVRPDVWYNGYDGLKVGGSVKGGYMGMFHQFNASLWLNTGLFQKAYGQEVFINKFDNLSFRINYSHMLPNLLSGTRIKAHASSIAGLQNYKLTFNRRSKNKKHLVEAQVRSLFMTNATDLNYRLYANEWNTNQIDNNLNLSYRTVYSYPRGYGRVRFNLRTTAPYSDYSYNFLNAEFKNYGWFGKAYYRTRVFAQLGTGSYFAPQSKLFLAGASPEQLIENKYTRADGITPVEWAEMGVTTNHFQAGGGLNLRGYAGYLAPVSSNGQVYNTYKGTTGASASVELEFDRYLGLNRTRLRKYASIATYAFGDAGIINIEDEANLTFADLKADAGLGLALTIKKFWVLETVRPLTLRADFPIFLSSVPYVDSDINGNPEYLKFRWIIGVNRVF